MTEIVAIDPNAIDPNAIVEEKNNHVIYMLNASGVTCNSFKDLNGLLIQREVLINDEKYTQIIKTDLPIFFTWTAAITADALPP